MLKKLKRKKIKDGLFAKQTLDQEIKERKEKKRKTTMKNVGNIWTVQSQGTDAKGGVAVGESEWVAGAGETATVKSAIMVGQLWIVVNTVFWRPITVGGREVRKRLRPFPDRLGETVVHLQGENVGTIAEMVGPDKDQEKFDQENGRNDGHYLLLMFLVWLRGIWEKGKCIGEKESWRFTEIL